MRLFNTIAGSLLLLQSVYGQFVHPGLSHKLSDLDRMKYMVEAGIDPWAETYELLKENRRAKYTHKVLGNPETTTMTTDLMKLIRADGVAAYYNALQWYITGDERHAKKAVEIFNAWSYLKRNENSLPLENGLALWRLLEGAEIIKHTYDGWAQEDMERFKAMLVYPGYSNTTAPTKAIQSKDVTFYWYIYNGDPKRHGNQGLHYMRTLMAMGIFLDNEIMYDRALLYLEGEHHREDDLPYPAGPPVTSDRLDSSNEYYDEFQQISRRNSEKDFGYNAVMSNYIWENGQCQESSRDQSHTIGGVNLICVMSEMAWSQGDDLYGHLDNRPLLGHEFSLRYNLSFLNSFPDQPTPWEPTVESGEFIERMDRTGRWKSLKINPFNGNNTSQEALTRGKKNTAPIYEMNLAHYRDRIGVPSEDIKWLERGFKLLTDELGVEREGSTTAHSGWGGLTFRRLSPGDPVKGFSDDLPIFAIHTVPGTIEAENYDHFPLSGQGRTYHDTTKDNTSGLYRDDDVDIWAIPGGGFAINQIDSGEWLNYTIQVSKTGNYDIGVRYLAQKEGILEFEFEFQGKAISNEIALPLTEGLNWGKHPVAKNVPLEQGVQTLKLIASGASAAYVLDSIFIIESTQAPTKTVPATTEPVEEVQEAPALQVSKSQSKKPEESDSAIAPNRQTLFIYLPIVLCLVLIIALWRFLRKK